MAGNTALIGANSDDDACLMRQMAAAGGFGPPNKGFADRNERFTNSYNGRHNLGQNTHQPTSQKKIRREK